jgi:hypothetical protein
MLSNHRYRRPRNGTPNESGIVLLVREGLEVWAFVDRKRMRLSNQL